MVGTNAAAVKDLRIGIKSNPPAGTLRDVHTLPSEECGVDCRVDAIQMSGVTKNFGELRAVNDLSLAVPRGCLYGFIGPNGSGKTTTLRMIMSILRPDAGDIEVLGERNPPAAKDRVGYLPEERGLYKKMKVRRLLRYYGQLKNANGELESRIDEWLAKMDLTDWENKPVETLSKGMAQKVQFISTVIAAPDLVILDEPFSGLDPVNMEVLREAVLGLRERGATVIFSTHDMAIAERMCDRIFMIYRGRKVLDGSLEEIQSEYGQDTVRVRIGAGAKTLKGMPGVESVRDHGQVQEVRLRGDAQEFLRALMNKTAVHHFEQTRPSLHDIFVRIARPTDDKTES